VFCLTSGFLMSLGRGAKSAITLLSVGVKENRREYWALLLKSFWPCCSKEMLGGGDN